MNITGQAVSLKFRDVHSPGIGVGSFVPRKNRQFSPILTRPISAPNAVPQRKRKQKINAGICRSYETRNIGQRIIGISSHLRKIAPLTNNPEPCFGVEKQAVGVIGKNMKNENPESKEKNNQQQDPNFRKKTEVKGQNPKANDDPSHDEHNDQNRKP
ncbi:MAG: hypothetical protein ACO1QB_05580 [Verrucomicrobiales bacterium]